MEKKLGVEIEFTGVRRIEVVKALENLFHTVAEGIVSKSTDDGYIYHKINDWMVIRDRSIKPQAYAYKVKEEYENRFDIVSIEDSEYMVELVSPALTSESLPLLFTIIDIIKSLGGIVNESCGLHVHIDKPDSVDDICNLIKHFYNEQESIFQFFNVNACRLGKYCKPYKYINVDDLKFSDESDLLDYFYRKYADTNMRSIRYYALNLYSLVQHGTIEFRLFNSSLEHTEVARILDWVLHFVYSVEEYNHYIPVLGGILMREVQY